MIKWAGKQAYGLREMCSRFKRLLWGSKNAKSPKIREMKNTYFQMKGSSAPEPVLTDENPPDALQLVEQGLFDWSVLEGKVSQALAAAETKKLGKLASTDSMDSSESTADLRKGNEYLLPLNARHLFLLYFTIPE